MSQRACERIFGVSNKTVAKLFEEAGDMAIKHVADLKNLEIAKVQADELHAFVGAKDKTLKRILEAEGEVRDEAGTIWGYLAMCADTKLVFAYRLGERTNPEALAFFRSVAAALKPADGGGFATRPTIVTDGLRAYRKAYDDAFGSDADFATITKHYSNTDRFGEPTPRSKYEGATRKAVFGAVDEAQIHTNYIERQNLNVRMQNRRYARRTNAFSKTMRNHERHLALWIVYHNYCWIPRPKRPSQAEREAGSTQWLKRETAALAAGLTKKLWTVEDLLDATDEFVAAQHRAVNAEAEAPPAETPPGSPINDAGEVQGFAAPFWVYRSYRRGQECKVHAAHCCNCRDGQGKKAGAAQSGEWRPFQTLEAAIAYATSIDPSGEPQCSMCLVGRYRGRVGIKDVQNGNPRSRR